MLCEIARWYTDTVYTVAVKFKSSEFLPSFREIVVVGHSGEVPKVPTMTLSTYIYLLYMRCSLPLSGFGRKSPSLHIFRTPPFAFNCSNRHQTWVKKSCKWWIWIEILQTLPEWMELLELMESLQYHTLHGFFVWSKRRYKQSQNNKHYQRSKQKTWQVTSDHQKNIFAVMWWNSTKDWFWIGKLTEPYGKAKESLRNKGPRCFRRETSLVSWRRILELDGWIS